MRYPVIVALVAASIALSSAAAPPAERKVAVVTQEQLKKMEDAAPDKPPAPPAKSRKVLVWGHLWTHDPNPFAAKALEVLGKKSGAFQAVVSEDPNTLMPDSLKQFDALVMNNIHEPNPFLPADLAKLPKEQQDAAKARDQAIKKSVLDFVTGGKGIVGIHAATAACQPWPEYGEMIGGYYGGHIAQQVTIKVEEPNHPVTACFKGEPFKISDEIYISKEPYSRQKVRVLLSLDLGRMEDPGKRPDKDYAISWVRSYGKGRVFYCTLGHAAETYWNPLFLRHVLAGIQFAIGDLQADAAPSTKGP